MRSKVTALAAVAATFAAVATTAVVGAGEACDGNLHILSSTASGGLRGDPICRDGTCVTTPSTVLDGISFSLDVALAPLTCQSTSSVDESCRPWPRNVSLRVEVDRRTYCGQILNATGQHGTGAGLNFRATGAMVSNVGTSTAKVVISLPDTGAAAFSVDSVAVFAVPRWLSLLPPLATLVLAMVTRQVIVSLFFGIWLGTFFLTSYNPVVAFLRTFDTYFVEAFTGEGHGTVILFSCVLGGVIALVEKSGGAQGLALYARQFASSRKRGLMCAWVLSMLIFFDDYSAILIAGATLKSSSRAIRISKAKLAFIIHAVGVNLPSLCPVSSWVGVEIGYIRGQYAQLGISGSSAFMVFIRTIPYRFFPLLMIFFPLIVILSGRDLGALLHVERDFFKSLGVEQHGRSPDEAEGAYESPRISPARLRHSRSGSDVSQDQHETFAGDAFSADVGENQELRPPDGAPRRWANAAVPFLAIIVFAFAGMYSSGRAKAGSGASLSEIFGSADSVNALLWSAAGSSVLALVSLGFQRFLPLQDAVQAWVIGFRNMMEPLLVLVLAWGLGGVIRDLMTSVYLASLLSSGLPAAWLPTISTCMAGLISFASGSAMGTMGILFPLILPLAASLGGGDEAVVMQSAAAIFAGSTMGNTCSPIADTTVLSSLATGCELVSHTKTIMPYTLLVFGVSLVFGSIPTGFGWYGSGIGLAISLCVLCCVVFGLGVDAESGAGASPGACGGTAALLFRRCCPLGAARGRRPDSSDGPGSWGVSSSPMPYHALPDDRGNALGSSRDDPPVC